MNNLREWFWAICDMNTSVERKTWEHERHKIFRNWMTASLVRSWKRLVRHSWPISKEIPPADIHFYLRNRTIRFVDEGSFRSREYEESISFGEAMLSQFGSESKKMHVPKIARACIPVPGIGFRNFFCASIGFSSSTTQEKPLLLDLKEFCNLIGGTPWTAHLVRKPMCEQNRAGRRVNWKNTPTHSNARQQEIRDWQNILNEEGKRLIVTTLKI